MQVVSGSESIDISANSHQIEGVKYRTIDKEIQEDAISVETQGLNLAGIKLSTNAALLKTK